MLPMINLRNIITGCLLAFPFFMITDAFAQQNETEAPGYKTITIHVTREENGKTTVIDTTVVTDGDFDADLFLKEKGVLDDSTAGNQRMEKRIIIRSPGSEDFEFHGFGDNFPDSLFNGENFSWNFNNDPEKPFSIPRHFNMPFDLKNQDFDRQFRFPDSPSDNFGQRIPEIPGLEQMMPFGNMEKMVVKKKRHGKKVIITFGDEEKGHERHAKNREERVIRYRNGQEGEPLRREERVIIDRGGESKGMQPLPGKKQKKVIIIERQEKK